MAERNTLPGGSNSGPCVDCERTHPWRECDGEIEPLFRDKMAPDAFYDDLDPGIRFAVKVLHAYGLETCQSCQGGPGHAYPEPTVDLIGSASELPAFAALHFLEAYGLTVRSVAQVWNVEHGRIHETVWRVELRKACPERADDWPMFVMGSLVPKARAEA